MVCCERIWILTQRKVTKNTIDEIWMKHVYLLRCELFMYFHLLLILQHSTRASHTIERNVLPCADRNMRCATYCKDWSVHSFWTQCTCQIVVGLREMLINVCVFRCCLAMEIRAEPVRTFWEILVSVNVCWISVEIRSSSSNFTDVHRISPTSDQVQ